MRGADVIQESMFTTVILERYVPKEHPLRPIRALFNEALKQLNGLFESIYADGGRDSIAPEKLLRAQLLQVLYSIRSERMLVEQISYNLLFRWFVGLAIEEDVWNHSTFSKNRDRLLEQEVIPELFNEVVQLAGQRNLLSADHFSVDGTLIRRGRRTRALCAKTVAMMIQRLGLAAMPSGIFAVKGARTTAMNRPLTMKRSCTRRVAVANPG